MKLAMSVGVQNTYQMMELEYLQGIETSLVVFIFVFICTVLFVFLYMCPMWIGITFANMDTSYIIMN